MSKRTVAEWIVGLRGLRQWKEADARRVLEAQERSGESIAAFARHVGLVPQRLFWWRERLGWKGTRQEARPTTSALTFVPLTVRSRPSSVAVMTDALVVTVGDDLRIDVREVDASTAAWVSTVVRSVRAST